MWWTFKQIGSVIALILAFHGELNAQGNDNQKANRFYEFEIECPIKKCDISGEIIDTNIYIAPPHSKFTIVDLQIDKCVIRFTLFGNNKKRVGSGSYDSEDFTSYTYFMITKAQLDFKASPVTKSNIDLVVGNILTPIKLRFSPFDFTKDISIGATFGIKYSFNQTRQTALDALVGLGISTVGIDSLSSHGRTMTNVDLLAFSPSLGLVLEFGNAQIGIFTGIDFISNANKFKYDWVYANKPWISFGLGYSIFSFNLKR